MIELDGIKISEPMKRTMGLWQNEDIRLLDEDVELIDNAICFIACEHELQTTNNEKEALSIISGLSQIRKRLKLFDGIDRE